MKTVRTSLAVIVGAARVSGPGYDGPIGVKLIEGPLPDPLWQEFRAGLAELRSCSVWTREGDEALSITLRCCPWLPQHEQLVLRLR
jgi:hypothetical protein